MHVAVKEMIQRYAKIAFGIVFAAALWFVVAMIAGHPFTAFLGSALIAMIALIPCGVIAFGIPSDYQGYS